MADSNTKPCIPLPNPEPLKITLPFGELKSLVDTSKGPPTDCTLVHSLMLQLTPTLAGMTCFLKAMNVLKVLINIDISNPASIDPVSIIIELVKAVKKMEGCINVFGTLPKMLKDILLLLVAYLKCIIQAIESIVNFQADIDLTASEGNPVVLASLTCAQQNAQNALNQQVKAMEVINPLLEAIKPIAELAGVSLNLPDLSKLSNKSLSVKDAAGLEELAKTLEELNIALEQLQQTAEALPV